MVQTYRLTSERTLWYVVIDGLNRIDLPDYCQMTTYADDVEIKVAAKCDRDMALRGNLAMKRVNKWIESKHTGHLEDQSDGSQGTKDIDHQELDFRALRPQDQTRDGD